MTRIDIAHPALGRDAKPETSGMFDDDCRTLRSKYEAKLTKKVIIEIASGDLHADALDSVVPMSSGKIEGCAFDSVQMTVASPNKQTPRLTCSPAGTNLAILDDCDPIQVPAVSKTDLKQQTSQQKIPTAIDAMAAIKHNNIMDYIAKRNSNIITKRTSNRNNTKRSSVPATIMEAAPCLDSTDDADVVDTQSNITTPCNSSNKMTQNSLFEHVDYPSTSTKPSSTPEKTPKDSIEASMYPSTDTAASTRQTNTFNPLFEYVDYASTSATATNNRNTSPLTVSSEVVDVLPAPRLCLISDFNAAANIVISEAKKRDMEQRFHKYQQEQDDVAVKVGCFSCLFMKKQGSGGNNKKMIKRAGVVRRVLRIFGLKK